jgi:predicted ATPase/class 3 adenylate cyclase
VAELPTGTVTFLFTDLEGSTRLWEEQPGAMQVVLARHDEILREAIGAHGGQVVKSTGDGMLSVFASAHGALEGCLAAQRTLIEEAWPESTGPLRVRMGVHAGEAELRDGDYYGSAVNRVARLTAVGHGGQVLVSESVEPLVRGGLPSETTLVDLGLHRLRDLADGLRVFQLSHPDLVGEFAPLRSLDVLPGNLPRQVTTFVGRDRELADLAALVRGRSLVTLTGVGGVGKTRLALQLAADVVPEFPDGAWLCELAPVGEPGALWDVVATTLGVPLAPGRSVEASVLEYLAPKRLLLVLDNCEHLLDGVARVVDTLTRHCSGVTVLATSREGLALPGEQLVAVPSLGLPSEDDRGGLPHSDSVQLFVERAQDAKRDFQLTASNGPAVAQLCRRLDGIPLAIELAAARIRSLSPQDLVDRLDQRFRLLTRGSRVGLERHQTLRSTIDWSYELLSGSERAALNRLSVFAGGCGLAAAEAVLPGGELDAADAVDVLGQLVDKSLIVVETDEHTGTRYSLSETIRQYAQEHLEAEGEAATLRARHADHFVGVAEAAGPRLRSRDQLAVSAATASEVDNFRGVLEWAIEYGAAEHALRLIVPLAVTGTAIGEAAIAWADAACAIPEAGDHELFPAVLAWAAYSKVMQGDLARGQVFARAAVEAQARLGTQHLRVWMAPALVALFAGDVERWEEAAQEWVRQARAAGDPYELSSALLMLGAPMTISDPRASLPLIEESVQIARDAGLYSSLAIGLTMLAGAFLISERSDDDATTILDEARQVGLLVGDRLAVAQVTFTQSYMAMRRGDWHGMLRAARDAADQRLGLDLVNIQLPFSAASIALARLDGFEASAVLLGYWDTRPSKQEPPHDVLDQHAQTETILVAALGENELAALRKRGAALSATEAAAYLRTETERVLGQ